MFRVSYYEDTYKCQIAQIQETELVSFKGTNRIYNKLMGFILKSIMLCLRYEDEYKMIQ